MANFGQISNLETIKCSFGKKNWFGEPQNRFWNPKIGFGSAFGASQTEKETVLEGLERVLAASWAVLRGSWEALGGALGKISKNERGASLKWSLLACQNGSQNLQKLMLKIIMFSDLFLK